MKRIWLLLICTIFSCTPVYIAEKAFEQKDYNRTVELCRDAIKIDPADADAYFLKGQAFVKLDKLDSAVVAMENANQLMPEKDSYKQGLAQVGILKGDNFLGQKKYRQAVEEYETAAKWYPTLLLYEKIGDTYHTWGKYDQALASYQKAEVLPGDNLNVRIKIDQIKQASLESERCYNDGLKLMKEGQFPKAEQLLAQAIKLKPDHIEAIYQHHMAKGLLLHQKGGLNNLWDAIAEYGLAASLKPDRGEPHYYMGLAYDRKDRKEFDNAISEFEIAIQKEPNGPYVEIAKKKIQECMERKQQYEAKQKKIKEFFK